MIDASQIQQHMEVKGSDDKHVGKVDHVLGTDIELSRLDFGSGFRRHLIPLSWVDYVDDRHVHLNLTAEQARAAWREKHQLDTGENLADWING